LERGFEFMENKMITYRMPLHLETCLLSIKNEKGIHMLKFLSHLSHVRIAKSIQKLLHKNQIKILHFIPGRIRLQSPLWINETKILKSLVEELEQEPRILSVIYTKEIGSLLVLYDNSPLDDYTQIEQWLKKADSITNH
jgi:hypothetical protein